MFTCRYVSISIDRSPSDVYDFASNPANLPRWASGLSSGTVSNIDGEWVSVSPMGRITVRFVDRNTLGVLDHEVTLPTGESFYNPMRVVANDAGSELSFTLFRRPDVTDAAFEADAATIASDLAALKALLEAGATLPT